MSISSDIGTVVIIDDDEVDQMMYRRIIMRSGLVRNLISFQYAAEALDYLESNRNQEIDIIFLDINMPRMDGFEFLNMATSVLEENFLDTAVVMLTTSLNPDDQARACQYRVVKNYIGKPLTEANLRDVIDSIAGQRQAL